MRGSRQGI